MIVTGAQGSRLPAQATETVRSSPPDFQPHILFFQEHNPDCQPQPLDFEAQSPDFPPQPPLFRDCIRR